MLAVGSVLVKHGLRKWKNMYQLVQKIKYFEGIFDYLQCKASMLKLRKFNRFCREN